MSAALWVLVVALGITTVANTLLTFAVIRRLREIEARRAGGDDPLPAVGTRVGEFSARTVSGEHVDQSDVASGEALVGFFLEGCGPCAKLIETLVEAPADLAMLDPLFFVTGDAASEETREIAAKLRPLGRVALVGKGPDVGEAFGGITSYPALLGVRDGVVTRTGRTLESVGGAPAARAPRAGARG